MEQLSSGLVGLVLGAVLGLALSVFFEDALKRGIAKSARTVRRALARPPAPEARGEFSLGLLHTSVVLVEGDGSQVIDEQAVDVIVDPDPVSLPDDVEQLRSEVAVRQEALTAAGLQSHWNGPTYAVAGLSIRRLGIDESPGVHLRLKSTDYFTFLATQQLDRELPDGATLRSKYVDPFAPADVPEFMRASFGTYTVVVTADELTLFAKRSQHVGAFPGCWDVSANEALSRSLDSHGRTPPGIYDVARRGLWEELGLNRTDYRLELLAFDIDRRTNQWGCVFVAFLHEITGSQLAERRTRGVADKWEHDETEFVRFTVPHVVNHLLRPDRRNNWTPVAPAAFHLALVRRFGRSYVERLTAQVLRKRADG
ncbi:hypothetical protein ACIRSS_42660 [Amycolatopsis sp. NPDC101161]|uniref:hypothetical protein n=1 Tax=Amycolatopsis sp. NPDC101161 TaxID=3363940 RepID=UPI0037F71E8D